MNLKFTYGRDSETLASVSILPSVALCVHPDAENYAYSQKYHFIFLWNKQSQFFFQTEWAQFVSLTKPDTS
jgi:hypothetical protein